MIIVDRVARNFSRSPAAYERLARCQRRAAASLARFILAEFANLPPPRRILELGCGTGFLTRPLAATWPESDLTISDLSPAMLTFCRQSLTRITRTRHGHTTFIVHDAAHPLPPGSYDLITAALMAQWLTDPSAALRRWRAQLTPAGRIVISALLHGTFANIHNHFAASGIPFPAPPLPTPTALRETISATGATITAWHQETRRERYPNLLAFLRQLQAVGAGNAMASPLTPSQLRTAIRHAATPLQATYHIAHLALS